MATVFTPLTKSISWVDSITDATGAALPTGESLISTTLGIRADLDTAHSAGNYSSLVIVPAPSTNETLAALTAALTKALPPGNYWLAVQQTDSLSGTSATSAWGTEVPFSIPLVVVVPAAPTGLSVS